MGQVLGTALMWQHVCPAAVHGLIVLPCVLPAPVPETLDHHHCPRGWQAVSPHAQAHWPVSGLLPT